MGVVGRWTDAAGRIFTVPNYTWRYSWNILMEMISQNFFQGKCTLANKVFLGDIPKSFYRINFHSYGLLGAKFCKKCIEKK